MTIEDLINLKEPLEPETIDKVLPGISPIEKERIQVIHLLKTSRAAYEDMDIFENVVFVLNKLSPDIDKMEGCSPEMIWKALDTIYKIHPKLELSDEVKDYIKIMFKDYGYIFYPPKAGIENNPYYEEIKKLALEGPFPLVEDKLGVQAMRYLRIMEYLKNG